MNTLAPSLSLEEAASRPLWDVVVVGAGCAGALAAHELARRGRSVLLVDKASFPRWKVCGCCINLRAQEALRTVNLGGLLRINGAVPLHTLHLGAQGRAAEIALPGYVALSREVFDTALVRAGLDAGVTFLPRTQATVGEVHEDYRAIALRQGEETKTVKAKLLLAADGLGGRLLRPTDPFDSPPAHNSRIGAGAIVNDPPDEYASGNIYMACGKGGYVGLVRVEEGRLDIAAAFDASLVRSAGGLAEAATQILSEAGFPAFKCLSSLTWRGTPALTRKATLLSAHRALVLGDAAGYVEPFTGEGMTWALNSAVAIADIADRAVDSFSAAVERQWKNGYRNVVRRRQSVCRLMASALRRPGLMRRTVALLSYAPFLGRPVVNHVNASPNRRQGVQQV